jgi:2-polyprenyl-6-methoxyphenol hydroxylase-like FAD-dependent oxidoreductase
VYERLPQQPHPEQLFTCYFTDIALLIWHFRSAQVYERLPEPPAPDDLSVWGNFEQASERLYMIGLNGRGQAVLRNLGVMDRIDTASSLVLGRLDWQPNSAPDSPKPTYYTTRTYKTRCIQRDRLASCLLQELREKYAGAVSVTFDARCMQAEWRQDGSSGKEVRSDRATDGMLAAGDGCILRACAVLCCVAPCGRTAVLL